MLTRAEGSWGAYRIGSGSASSTFSNDIFSETAWLIEPNYMLSLHGVEEQKFVHNVWSHDQDGGHLGHVTRHYEQTCPYMVKTFKYLLLRNRIAEDLET